MEPTAIERLYAVADDHETDVLDALRERAGLTWECRDVTGYSHWTNDETDKSCGGWIASENRVCGKPRPA